MGSDIGKIFKVTTWGESHGHAVGVVVDGMPPGITIDPAMLQADLDRRKPGQSAITTQRREPDSVEILSGMKDNITLGTPISMLVRNNDARPKDYKTTQTAYRPSHADYTYHAKYGITAASGGGRASARETVARVAAGSLAKQLLRTVGMEVIAWVASVADITASILPQDVTQNLVEANAVRCPDPQAAAAMETLIKKVRKQGDSVGGVIRAVCRKVPPGLGDPVFDKLDADIAKALMSIPAVKAVSIGSGFEGTRMTGSQHNDAFVQQDGKIRTASNYSGGIQGGISNGEPITVAAGFKPTATIMQPQNTVNFDGQPVTLQAHGRHDPCVLPRAVPIVEAMLAIVLTDHWLRHRAQCQPIT